MHLTMPWQTTFSGHRRPDRRSCSTGSITLFPLHCSDYPHRRSPPRCRRRRANRPRSSRARRSARRGAKAAAELIRSAEKPRRRKKKGRQGTGRPFRPQKGAGVLAGLCGRVGKSPRLPSGEVDLTRGSAGGALFSLLPEPPKCIRRANRCVGRPQCREPSPQVLAPTTT